MRKLVTYPYEMRVVNDSDILSLVSFFNRQPRDAFKFFHPHKFDEDSLRRIVHNKSFLAFLLVEKQQMDNEVVGYAFMRSFANGASYRGYMVDARHRGKGLAKIMGYGLNGIGDALGLKMYKSISPDNMASMKATQAVCDVEILKTLDNGDYLIKCMSKYGMNKNTIGGGKCAVTQIVTISIVPQDRRKYAA